ncbi:sporulation protein [Rhizobium sp. R72]|uniref:SPOR domain-containing protein n=1 Tax=unclassified Rhizobium TaxID=2613769 RepID=UPI000B52E9F1|nr:MULTISPECIES: SPOR domain-containing protein [unclassified Rhizobium]OWV94439.1 sporulation protein [Rhizobium sp. R72]OWV94709.1 sporulation protein [Rhizobium sp. R711]OWV99215.1 sporulation protein [Rhizobium sp. R693]
MADKQRAYDTRKNTDLFADDDPLAELARIVGFEPRVAANTVEDAPRQEPAFNLEDELLREFERYDEPQSAASFDRLSEPVLEQPVAYEAPVEADVPPVAMAEPEFVVQPELAGEPLVRQPFDRASNLTSAAWASVAREGEPVAGGARDLIEELEMSIGAAPAPAAPVTPVKAPQWSAASIRLPIANFHPARRDEASSASVTPVAAPAHEPIVVASESVAAFDVPVAAGFPAEIDRHEEPDASEMRQEAPVVESLIDHSAFDLAAAAKDDGAVQADAALTEAAPVEIDDITFDIDELLADVSHYPVPERQTAPAADVAEMPTSPEPARPAAPVVAPLPTSVEQLVPAPAAKAEPEGDDPFAGHDFELDLEGIELELADFDFAEPVKAQPQAVEAQRVPAQHIQEAKPQPVAPVPAFQPAPAPIVAAAPISQASAEAAFVTKAPVAPAFSADAGDDLPFDPSMISDAEYHPEAVEEMHVPVLPPVEQPEPVVATSDFDFDVDAEIANLLAPAKPAETPAKPAVEAWRTRAPISVAPAAAPAAAGAKQVPLQSLDEFERALEEDFRRSVNEPVQRRENISQVQIQSASEAEDMSRARSMKRMLAAAAAIVVFGGVAYAGYTLLARDGGLGITSGEPRVITADKDPVKVVPDNPGGKTVPNQDKAVYDSVGGAAAEAPKQKALVSSDEQPVDVVQRTLTPETLPEDNDSDIAPPMATPVGDTQDPRLLPSQDTAATDEADNANQAPSVSARKVRTMIVRPDGTLVARDEPAPEAAPTLPKATPVQTQKVTAGSKPAGGTAANFPASGQVASADIRSTPVEEAKPTPAQAPSENALAKAAAATPANVDPPVRAVKSSTVSDAAPAPATRPAATNAVQAPAGAPAAPAAQKPKEVAAVSPAATQAQPTAAAGGYGVQIASLPSEDEAKKSYASLSKKFASVLAGRSYEIRKADIAGKGTFYRVRIPAGSKDEAAAVCEKYRAAGGSCLISK